jgi:general secretion pathway protein D
MRRHSLPVARTLCTAFVLLLSFAPAAMRAQQAPVAQAGTRLDFHDVRLDDLIRSVASLIGVNVVLAEIPDKRTSFSTAGPVRAADLPGVLESLLEANGLVAVQRGTVVQVFPADKAPATGQVHFGMDLPDPPPLGIVTQLVPLQAIQADEGAAALRQVASPLARIEPVTRSNSLLITDRGVYVARYLEVLRRLDERPQGEAGLRTYVVPLKYADADDLAESLGRLFGISIALGRGRSLDDMSLSRQLEGFRQREAESFRVRSGIPTIPPAVRTLTSRGDTTAIDTGTARSGALVGQTTIVSSGPTNALIIRTAPPNFPLLQETIQSLDLRPAQVLFEVTVAEITLGRDNEWGIDWDHVGGSTTTTFGNTALADTASPSTLVLRFVSLRNADIRAVLRAIATTSQVRVLSTPEVLASNNREARVLVGSRVPFVASTRLGNDVAIDRAVQYENVGTQLTLVPTINEDDYVSVQILQEVSSLTTQTVAAALNAPVISTREASTRTVMKNGQTVVIAGLIGTSDEDNERGVPFLKDIPLLGYLFKSKSVTHNRTELAIFVTPYLVRTDADADLLRERIRRRMNERMPGTLPDTGQAPGNGEPAAGAKPPVKKPPRER